MTESILFIYLPDGIQGFVMATSVCNSLVESIGSMLQVKCVPLDYTK